MTPANKPLSMLDQREAIEAQVLKEIEEMGYQSPLDSADNGLLALRDPNGKWRRYITGWKYVRLSDLDETQVRKKVINEEYCKTDLAPKIQRDGQRVPALIALSHIPDRHSIITGHHRFWVGDYLDTLILALVVTRPISLDGTPVAALADLVSKIQANKSPDRIQYTIEDAVIAIAEAFRVDASFEGLNPGGQVPLRENSDGFDWDNLMDYLYGETGYFLHKSTRTKIRNQYLKGRSAHKIIDMAKFSEQTAFLARLGWDAGLSSTGKRVDVLKHFDSSRDAMVLLTDSNGRHISEKMLSYLEGCLLDPDFVNTLKNNNIKYIDVACRIYSPPTDKASLDSQRDNVKKVIKKWKDMVAAIPVFPLELRTLAFPKQLRSGTDADLQVNIRKL
jgi:hypothetical protein|tara:strand:- start:113 stop:1285 length:1173 start_codon:yes stop_codon:yes gene_type:complete